MGLIIVVGAVIIIASSPDISNDVKITSCFVIAVIALSISWATAESSGHHRKINT